MRAAFYEGAGRFRSERAGVARALLDRRIDFLGT